MSLELSVGLFSYVYIIHIYDEKCPILQVFPKENIIGKYSITFGTCDKSYSIYFDVDLNNGS